MQQVVQALQEFAHTVRRDRKANPPTADGSGLEPLLAPRFQALVESVLAEVTGKPPRVLPEYRRPGVGRPDLALVHEGRPARAFVELKEPRLPLEPRKFTGHNKEQFARFSNLPLWALCNFERIQLYRRDELEAEALVVPATVLDPDTPDHRATRIIRNHDSGGLRAILQTLASAEPPIPDTPADAATNLAHAARLVRDVVSDHCRSGAVDPVVSDLRVDFIQTLFARAEAGGYDSTDENSLFSNAFAQTLVFGLLLARDRSGESVGPNAHELLPNTSFPLLRGTLRALTMEEIRRVLGTAFDVATDAVNAVDPALLRPTERHDPLLYLYEDFLRVFDPEAVKRYGVYYTPPDVVRLMVAEVDRLLLSRFRTNGLLDEKVNLLDPACGTGTFLLAATSLAAERASQAYGSAAAAAEVASFAQRAHAFELLVGPYTVAHYRMQREVSRRGGQSDRLPIFLTDTLAPAASEAGVQPNMAFLSAPLIAEREAADQVKQKQPILVVMGNPPYKRLRAAEATRLVGPFMNGLWNDLKQPVREAGLGRSLNAFPDLYVAFYRWALWRLFEANGASGRGVLAFITNRKFLVGSAFGGLRRMLRRRFDRIRIIDFRGDKRASRPAVVPSDENIFNIEVGVCVLLAEAHGGRDADHEASVEYADVWRHDAFDRPAKLGLARLACEDPETLTFRETSGRDMEPLFPRGFDSVDWPSLDRLFTFRSNGIVTYRDRFAYALSAESLHHRIEQWLNSPLTPEAREHFKETRDRKAAPAHATAFDESALCRIAYRPLDRRYLYNRREFIDFPKLSTLQAAWGQGSNFALQALNDGTGDGPAVWCHGVLPDQHAFRGQGGGWVFPLFDHRGEGPKHSMLNGTATGLSSAYGVSLEPQQVFDAILALLSATKYTVRFAYDLENVFPHVPFPADKGVFVAAAKLGSRLRKLETFTSAPAEKFRWARLEGRPASTLAVPARSRAFSTDQGAGESAGRIALVEDRSFVISGVSEAAWNFNVSGYPVLHRWLKARTGQRVDASLQREILDIVARVEELLHRFREADNLLELAVEMSLSTSQLSGEG